MSIAADFQDFRNKKIGREFAAFRKESLKGVAGPQGPVGPQGIPGESVTLEEVIRTLLQDQQFIDAVRGKDGSDGRDGVDGRSGKDGSSADPVDHDDLVEKVLDDERLLEKFLRVLPMGGISSDTAALVALEQRVKDLEDNPSGGLQYIQLTATGTTTYTSTDFIFGNNIIGVNAAGAVTIRLPDNLTPGTIVTINDESGNAGTNNITIETYLET